MKKTDTQFGWIAFAIICVACTAIISAAVVIVELQS